MSNAVPMRPVLPTLQQIQGMRAAILMQCCGALAMQVFGNGLMLLYLQGLGASESTIAACVSLPNFVLAITVLPLSYLADRLGRKRLGTMGVVGAAAGFSMITAAGSLHGGAAAVLLASGTAVYALGWAAMTASWWSMLEPIVPPERRGRFFGQMRFSFQLVGLLFVVGCAMLLSDHPRLSVLQMIMGAITLALIARIVIYIRHFPELGDTHISRGGVATLVRNVLRHPGFAGYAAYTSLWRFLHGGAQLLAALMIAVETVEQKAILIWLMGIYTVGSLVGQLFGGQMTDSIASAKILIGGHLMQAAAIATLVLRPAESSFLVAAGGLFGLGMAGAAGSVALTVKQYHMIPHAERSLSTSILGSLQTGGASLAGFAVAWTLSIRALEGFGQLLRVDSPHRLLLIAFGVGILLLMLIPMRELWGKASASDAGGKGSP